MIWYENGRWGVARVGADAEPSCGGCMDYLGTAERKRSRSWCHARSPRLLVRRATILVLVRSLWTAIDVVGVHLLMLFCEFFSVATLLWRQTLPLLADRL